MNKTTQSLLGPFLGFVFGVTLFVAVTTAVILLWLKWPSSSGDYFYGEMVFWASPLILLGFLLSLFMVMVGWPIVGFWIGRRAAQVERAAHRRYSLLLGGGLGLVLGLLCNLTAYIPARAVGLWLISLLLLLLLQTAAGLAAGYLLSILLWRKAAVAESAAEKAPSSRLTTVAQMGFILLLPGLICVGSVTLLGAGWAGVRTAASVAPTRPGATPTPVLLALGDLPAEADGLRADDLLLLNSPDGVLALSAGQTAPLSWQSAPDDLTAVLAAPYAQFDYHFYTADGRHADLSLLPHPPNGTVRISPNGRYIAYETAPRREDEADLGPFLHLYNLETGEDIFVSRENAIFDWSADSRYLYTRFRDRVFRYEPGAEGDRVTPLSGVNPQGDGKPELLAAADGLVFRVSSNLFWRGAAETAQNERLGPTQISRPFALSPDGRSLAWIRVSAPQLMLLPTLPTTEAIRPLPVENQIYHLAWSPQGDRLVIWAENSCQPGTTTLPSPENCPGDLYLVDLAVAGETAVTRLTDSQIPYNQITGLYWLQQ